MKNVGMIGRARNSLAGLAAAWRGERSFRDHARLSALLVALLALLGAPLWWWAVIGLAIACGLAMELVNAALEALCDKLHPERDPAIGRVKDLASAAAFVVNATTALLAAAMIADSF